MTQKIFAERLGDVARAHASIARSTMSDSAESIFTIGHSTRPWDEFLALLRRYEIKLLCDVRTAPGSRKHPQYNQANLEAALGEAGIGYLYCRELGGFRKASGTSPISGWRNASFRGYADYMQTEEFKAAVDRLVEIAGAGTTVIMCAEAVYWRCHRSLIAELTHASSHHSRLAAAWMQLAAIM